MKKSISIILFLMLLLNVFCSCANEQQKNGEYCNIPTECSDYEEFEGYFKQHCKTHKSQPTCKKALKIARFFEGKKFGNYVEGGYEYTGACWYVAVLLRTEQEDYFPIYISVMFSRDKYVFNYRSYEQIGDSLYKEKPDESSECDIDSYLYFIDPYCQVRISPYHRKIDVTKFDEDYEYYYDPEGKLLENFVALCEELKELLAQ